MDERGLHRDQLPRTIDRESFTPAYLTLVANAWSSANSVFYMRDYGIGVNDWRVLSTLANHPGATAVEVCGVVGLHKSVVSRSVATLSERGLVGIERSDGHRRLYLTPAGVDLHDELLPHALHKEELLLSGFEPAEVAQLRRFLRRMFLNIPVMNGPSDDDGTTGGDAPDVDAAAS
jgi:DNA-binding MarR family transcriptional regulator